jgi:hypothetical protein
MKVKTPASISVILSYCIFIGILDLLIMAFYFRDAYWEIKWEYTDYSYLWGAVTAGLIYGTLGTTLGALSIQQLKDTSKISYLGNLTLIIAVFSIVMAILGGILQQIVYSELDSDLWMYPNNLVVGAIALVPILIFLVSLPVFDRFRRVLDVKEEDPGRIIKLRKRGQSLALGTGVGFLVLVGLLSVGLFDHEQATDDINHYEKQGILDIIEVRPGVRIEIWSLSGWENEYRIVYTENGETFNRSFVPNLLGAVRWLEENGTPDEKIFCWWDYGDSIEGYTGMESVIDTPARYIEQTIADPSSIEEWMEDETPIRDVASGLIANDPSITLSLMEKYGANYLLTDIRDQHGILYAIVLGAGKDTDDYLDWRDDSLTELGQSTVIHRIWKGEDIPGLEVVYSDLEVKVLKRV